jgi:hypothetical protein
MTPADSRKDDGGHVLFPMDLDVRHRRFLFRNTSIEALRSNPFLDNRFIGADDPVQPVEADTLREQAMPQTPLPAFLLHTSFCCSTLLARLLDFPGRSLALKEPLILRRLADAKQNGIDGADLIALSLQLLFRDLDDGSAILLKPTHVALNLAAELLHCAPAAKTLLITSTLEDFMISNIKKSEDTQRKVPELVERFMSASDLPARLPPEAFEPPSFLAGVALQWHAQQQIVHDLMNGPSGSSIRLVQEAELLHAPAETLRAALDWLNWRIPDDAIEAQIVRIMSKHAKSISRDYDPREKQYETELLRQKFGSDLEQALHWSSRYLSPFLKTSP